MEFSFDRIKNYISIAQLRENKCSDISKHSGIYIVIPPSNFEVHISRSLFFIVPFSIGCGDCSRRRRRLGCRLQSGK